ncbi:hypothetical protein TESS_TESS_00849 [Tessaracoccus sp. O5.2]|uniref:AAA family ATPase n=1 Tax=Tessaracoccus sp. O5.2 TaxID=3157622 RepID=UPI0035ED2EF1
MTSNEWDYWTPEPPEEPANEEPEHTAPPSSWAPVDLEPVLSGTYVPPTPTLWPRADGLCLLYPGLTHSVHGESESGKSLIIQAETARLLSAGHDVLYLDFESDPGSVIDRLRMFGAEPDAIRSHLHYVHPETNLQRSDALRDWDQLLAHPYALAVIDGVTEALTMFGWATKENDDITTWHRVMPRRIADSTGAAVVLIDHVTKDSQTRGRFAIGGQAKLAALSGPAYSVEVTQPLGRGLRGVLSLRIGKDRPGYLRQRCGPFRHNDRTQQAAVITLDATVDPPRYEVEPPREGPDEEAHEFRPTALMQKVSKELEDAPTPLSLTQIEKRVFGNTAHIRTAAACLVSEGFAAIEDGPRNSKLHRMVKPYREREDPKSDNYRPEPPALPEP